MVSEFSKDYLFTFYSQGPTPDEEAVFEFLVRHYPKIESQPCIIEIGCGPAVHHVLPAAPFVSEVHMADYLIENLEQVRAWKAGRADAHNWHPFTALTLRLEGKPSDETEVLRRERELKDKITSLLRCDLRRDSPLRSPRQYPVVGCFYCTEVVGCTDVAGVTKEEWQRVMRRLAGLVAPGGYLFLSAVKETGFYALRSPGGHIRRLPVTSLTEDDFHETLPALGFDTDETIIESRDFTGQEGQGLHGVILVAGRKRTDC
jgi:NNMT/PNMT/TEMT family